MAPFPEPFTTDHSFFSEVLGLVRVVFRSVQDLSYPGSPEVISSE